MLIGTVLSASSFCLLLDDVVREVAPITASRGDPENSKWSPEEYRAPSNWVHLAAADGEWRVTPAGDYRDLDARLASLGSPDAEILIPVFPTVFEPCAGDCLYYNAILRSEIAPGDKVLVVGAGSGADSWAAWLKSRSTIYALDINPMAIANARVTARLAGFDIRAVVGDIRDVVFPEDFTEFDYVLWNMPFLASRDSPAPGDFLRAISFHDGDDGSIASAFLQRLPSLLKEEGRTILLNVAEAAPWFDHPSVVTTMDPRVPRRPERRLVVYETPNPGGWDERN